MDMSMEGMDGMDMSNGGLLRTYNEQLAHDFWFILAGFFGFMVLFRLFVLYEHRSRSGASLYPTLVRQRLFISSDLEFKVATSIEGNPTEVPYETAEHCVPSLRNSNCYWT